MNMMVVPYTAPQDPAAFPAYCNEAHLPRVAAIPGAAGSEVARLDPARLGEIL